jgi:hypothetical protein
VKVRPIVKLLLGAVGETCTRVRLTQKNKVSWYGRGRADLQVLRAEAALYVAPAHS